MSNLTAGQGSSVSQHLRATKKILQGVIFDAGYASGSRIRSVEGLRLMFARIAANFDTTEVKQTSEMDTWIVTNTWRTPYSRSKFSSGMLSRFSA